MFNSLGYSKGLLENFSIIDDPSLLFNGGECEKPSCQIKCVNCFSGCNQGPDPGGGPDEPI